MKQWSYIFFILASFNLQAKPQNDMMAAANVERGKIISKQCIMCHSFSETKNQKTIKLGPNLFKIFNRKIASLKGYQYSAALKKLSNKKWNVDELDHFLKKPQSHARKSKMFVHVTPDNDIFFTQARMDLIAYLKTLK